MQNLPQVEMLRGGRTERKAVMAIVIKLYKQLCISRKVARIDSLRDDVFLEETWFSAK